VGRKNWSGSWYQPQLRKLVPAVTIIAICFTNMFLQILSMPFMSFEGLNEKNLPKTCHQLNAS
jgi:hypothetical protein